MRSISIIAQMCFVSVAFVFLLDLNFLCAEDTKADSTDMFPRIAPPIVLRNMSGEYIFLSHFCYPGKEKPRKKRSVVVLNFMQSDCAPCRKEIPMFLKVVGEYKGKGVKAFLVSTDDISKRDDLKKMLEYLEVNCEVLLDPYKVACKKLGVVGIPQTFVLSPTSQIVAKFGLADDFETSLREVLKKLVQQEK